VKKLFAVVLCLALLGACTAPVVPEEPIATETTTTATTETIATTELIIPTMEWQGVPEAYWSVLDAIYELVQINRRWDHNDSYIWEAINFNYLGLAGPLAGLGISSEPGYALVDINGDGRQELVLLHMARVPVSGDWSDEDGEWEVRPSMIAIYTTDGNEAVKLGDWTWRSNAVLTADGIIFDRGSNSGFSSNFTTLKLEPGATRLTQLSCYTTDFIGGERVFRIGHGEWQPLSEERHEQLWDSLDNPPNPMPFNFIPIEQ